jgi:outer membrane protein, heavy metal efflux system
MIRARSEKFVPTRNTLRAGVMGLVLVGCLGCHCKLPPSRRPSVDGDLASRTGFTLPPETCPGDQLLPDSISLDDGVTAEEAVSVAMWNNAAFQELLSELGVSRAQLFNAGLFPDPVAQMFFPIGPKQFELTVYQGMDVLWLRPIRQRAAQMDLDQLATRLVQNGLDVIRDTRLAHADLLMAQENLRLTIALQNLRQEISRLATRRSEAGAISDLEATTPEVEFVQSEAEVARLTGVVEIARARLLVLMGLTDVNQELNALGAECPIMEVPSKEALVDEALAVRPDLLAAGHAMQAAAERLKLAKCQWIVVDGIADANSKGAKGFEIGPGARMTVPIFNGNKGNIAIAEAQYQMAFRRYVTIQNQIRLDVLTARASLEQALTTLDVVRRKLVPATTNASDLAKKNFEGGGTSYFLTLQTIGQDLTAQTQQATVIADVQRALAELERSVGHHIDCPPVEEPNPLEVPPGPQSNLLDLPACRPVSHQEEVSATSDGKTK